MSLRAITLGLGGELRLLCLTRNLSPELSSADALFTVDLDSPASFVADRSAREYFLHRRPIGLDPTTIMAAVAAGRDADLRKRELRTAPHFVDVEDRDGIVVRPPAGRAAGLQDVLARPGQVIDVGQIIASLGR